MTGGVVRWAEAMGRGAASRRNAASLAVWDIVRMCDAGGAAAFARPNQGAYAYR